MTGWAQVNGWRGSTSLERRIQYDLYYIENWSLTLDFKILWLTITNGLGMSTPTSKVLRNTASIRCVEGVEPAGLLNERQAHDSDYRRGGLPRLAPRRLSASPPAIV